MFIGSSFCRLISYRIVMCLSLFSSFTLLPCYFYSACDCSSPTLCPVQPTGPPYQPCTLVTSANSYILRYSINGDNGSMTFIGNSLGLSKTDCLNEPGTPGTVVGSIGAFMTTDPTLSVGSYASVPVGVGGPAGTTLDWRNNSSSAELTLPPGVTVLHAELIWSGSFGYFCSDPTPGVGVGVDPNCVLDFANGPINFTTPDGVTHLVLADPATALESQNPSPEVLNFYCAGNYTRTQDVTALITFLPGLNGSYTVGGVPATVSALDDTHNAAGWTLAIVYHDPSNPLINNMSLFLGAQQGSRASVVAPASISGFCAQTSPGLRNARILVSALEGDAENSGDQLLFGPTASSLTPLSGPNNLVSNFFGAQINDDAGNLISTTGTFCIYNQDPTSGVLIPNGRQGYDITNVDCSSLISSGQSEAFAIGTTTGDDYMINALGIQISVSAPVIVPIKRVNGVSRVNSELGDIVRFTFTMENTGDLIGTGVIFQDTLESGLQFVPGSLTLDSVAMPSADPVAGVAIGDVGIGISSVLEFDVQIISPPASGNEFFNRGNASFGYTACSDVISTLNTSNLVSLALPSADVPQPGGFYGTIKKCKFLNKNEYSLYMTWTPPSLSTVLSYQIFKAGVLQATIPSSSPREYETCIKSKKEAGTFTIVAVYPNGFQSLPLNIRITYD